MATAEQLVSGLYSGYFGLPDTPTLHLGVLGLFTLITLGMVLDMFPRVSGGTDSFNASGYPAKWTVFYGAWFLAYGPMMAIFFTGISIGPRTCYI